MLTTTKLPHHLQAVKRKLGLTLINFENATIELEPFVKKHPFESSQFLMHSIVKHYKDVRYMGYFYVLPTCFFILINAL